MVNIYTGKEIDNKKIKFIKSIAEERYNEEIYKKYFANLNDRKDLARIHNVRPDSQSLALGEDWFLCFTETDYYVQISEWVALNNENKLKQTVEMLETLKQIFLKNKNKSFRADMRHDTSYPMYVKMIERGLFKEVSEEYIIDTAAPQEFQDLKGSLMDTFDSMGDFLASEVAKQYTEYYTYILHHLKFYVTKKFSEKYNKQSELKRKQQ